MPTATIDHSNMVICDLLPKSHLFQPFGNFCSSIAPESSKNAGLWLDSSSFFGMATDTVTPSRSGVRPKRSFLDATDNDCFTENPDTLFSELTTANIQSAANAVKLKKR